MRAVSGAFKGECDRICGGVGKSASVHMDKAGFVVHGKNCWVWNAVGNPINGTYLLVKVHISGSRGGGFYAVDGCGR